MREDWNPLLLKADSVITEVMTAGERQRIASGRNPNAWVDAEPLERLNHVLKHILAVHHKQNTMLLTHDTQLEQIKHALVGILIILVNEDKENPKLTEAMDE